MLVLTNRVKLFLLFALIAISTMVFFGAANAQTEVITEPNVIGNAVQVIAANWTTYGWLGALSGLLSVLVMVFRAIAPHLWEKMPKWGQLLLVFTLSGIAAGIITGLSGVGIAAAVGAGIMAGLSAIGLNQGGKAIREIGKDKDENGKVMVNKAVRDPTLG